MPTVLQWVKLLESKIAEQAAYASPYEKRYRNEYVLPFIVKEYQEVYGAGAQQIGSQLVPPKTGMAAIGVDALVERMTVLGCRTDDKDLAKLLDRAWIENDLDVMHREAHRETLIKRVAFAQVDASSDGRAVVGIETAEQVAVHRQAAPPYDIDAALKISRDEWTGQRTARLWLPGRNVDLVDGKVQRPDLEDASSTVVSSWQVVDNSESKLPVIPVVEFSHKARPLAQPMSEIEPIETLVDIADLIEGLMVFAGHFGAVPIRFGSGLSVPVDKDGKPILDEKGRPLLGFDARADRFWGSTNPEAKFGQLTPAALTSFVEWADHTSQRIRARTQVASTYYSPDLKSHMSAELLKADEAPMVRRVKSMGEFGVFGQSWRRMLNLIRMIESPNSSAIVSPRWGDPETRVESLAADSVQKLVQSGLGVETVAQKMLGWSPEEVARAISQHDAAESRKVERDAIANDPIIAALQKQTADDAAVGY